MGTLFYLFIALLPVFLALIEVHEIEPPPETSHMVFAGRESYSITNIRNISGSFVIPDSGFHITFPAGWSGIDLGSVVLLGPTGINPRTGLLNPSSDLERIFLIVAWHNSSDFLRNRNDENLSSYHDYVNRSAERIGCKVLGDEFVKLNDISSEKVDGKCGRQEEVSMVTYSFAAGQKIISIGLKGITAAFDHNLESFMGSLKTIKIDNESDIQKLITESYRPE